VSPLKLLITLYATFYAVLSWRRFATFHAQIDMSYYLRQVWGLGHGHYDLPLVQAKNIIGLHLEPILLPLALLGRLGVPLAPMLLLFQALMVALSAWPAYRLGERHLGLGARGGLIAALVALLYPTVTVATLHDFHPVTVALFPLLGTVEALDAGHLRRALLYAAFALTLREDIALQLCCLLGAYALFGGTQLGRAQKLWLGLLAAGLLVYFFGYVLWLQPRYVPASGSYGLHFAKLGAALGTEVHSGRELVFGLLRHPGRFLGFILDGERLRYLVLLLSAMAFLPLLALRPLAGALPVLGINLLSSFPGVLRLESHYTTAIVPFVVGAGLIGAGRLRGLIRDAGSFSAHGPSAASQRVAIVVAAGLFVAALSSHLFHGGSPLSPFGDRFVWAHFSGGPRVAAIKARLAAVPPQASVAARPGPLAHLCERPRIISPPEYDDGQPVDVVLHDE
jgi:uncharacterized membrane protein